MKQRLFLLSFALLGLTLVGAGCFTTTVSTDTADNAVSKESVVVLRINNGEGSVVSYDGAYEENMTALAFLQTMASEKQFTVETTEYDGIGAFVNGINGKVGTATHFWLFSVNGEAATVGAGSYTVAKGDTIAFTWTAVE